jgi:hypothetical protein
MQQFRKNTKESLKYAFVSIEHCQFQISKEAMQKKYAIQ